MLTASASYSQRVNHDPHHTWQGDRGGLCNYYITLTSFDLISSFAANGPLSKCSTGRPALHSGLPVITAGLRFV